VDGTLPLPMILPALLHVAFTFGSQMLGITSRLATGAAGSWCQWTGGALSDRAALQPLMCRCRRSRGGRPSTRQRWSCYRGTASGFAGLVLDPAAGLRQPGALGVAGAIVGVIRAVLACC